MNTVRLFIIAIIITSTTLIGAVFDKVPAQEDKILYAICTRSTQQTCDCSDDNERKEFHWATISYVEATFPNVALACEDHGFQGISSGPFDSMYQVKYQIINRCYLLNGCWKACGCEEAYNYNHLDSP